MTIKKVFYVLVILINISLSYYIYIDEEHRLQRKQDIYKSNIKQLYKGTIDTLKLNATSIFESLINRDEVISIIRQLPSADKKKTAKLHEDLYHLLKDKYEKLQSYTGMRQLQFHQKDGKSFLRMHRPDKYGDMLFDVRYSVYLANTKKRFVEGFEEGRIFNGVRYVFPIIEGDEHYGSVEIGYSVSAIINLFKTIYPNNIFYFMIKRKIVEEKVFNEEQSNYNISSIGKNYLEDKEVSKLITKSDRECLKQISGISKQLGDKQLISECINKKGNKTIATFLPIENIKKNIIGYLIVLDKQANSYLQNDLIIRLSIIYLITIIAIYFISKILKVEESTRTKNDELTEALNEVQTLATMIENSNIEVYVIDKESLNFLYVNKLAITNTGKTLDEFCKLKAYELKLMKKNNFNNLIGQLKDGGSQVVVFEAVHEKKDKSKYSVEVRIQNIEYKTRPAYLAVILDISQRKELIDKLKSANEIMISRSRQAAMGETIGLLAHQWRQPIALIEMQVNNLIMDLELKEVDKESMVKDLNAIANNIEHLSNTITSFQAQFKEDEKPLDFYPIDTVTDALSIIQSSLDYHNIKVQIDNKVEQTLHTRKDLLFQVTLSLLTNAKEALVNRKIKKGIIKIVLSQKDSYINIYICDNAGGIELEKIDKVFEPYYTTKEELNDSGMGLYIAKMIIEKKCHGILSVKNIKNGVCFHITLRNM